MSTGARLRAVHVPRCRALGRITGSPVARCVAADWKEYPITSAHGSPVPPSPEAHVAVVFAAHPDDPDFGAGGTAAVWSDAGWEMHYVVLTNGAKGSSDRAMTRARLIPAREEEQRNAANVLGVRSVTFLGGEDGELEYTRAMLGKVVREIRRLRPYAVFTHSAEMLHRRPFRALAGEDEEFMGFVNHRDHRLTGTMVVDAIYPTARDHMNFPEQVAEGLEPHNVKEFYLFGSNEANFTVDITDIVDRKIEALTQHVSQFAERGEAFVQEIRKRWQDDSGRVQERFQRIILPR